MKIFLLLLLYFPFNSVAQETEPLLANCPTVPACPPCPTLPLEKPSSATYRDHAFGTLLVGYQFMNTWVPDKVTGSYTQIFNRDWSLEFEYASSKRDITIAGYKVLDLDEKRYTLLVKYYIGTSFHLSLGPYIYDIAFIPNKSSNDEFQIVGHGVAFDIGNRWQFAKGITFGIDWMRINKPLGESKVDNRFRTNMNESDRDKVEKTGKIFRTIPAFTFFGVNFGYTF